jgi:hypothetical protein
LIGILHLFNRKIRKTTINLLYKCVQIVIQRQLSLVVQ